MKERDDIWYDNEVQKLKKEKKEVLGELNGDDYYGTRSDNKARRSIKEDFKRQRRSIKRSERQNIIRFIDDEVNRMK